MIKKMAEKVMILTEEEWCMCQLGNDSSKTYAEYLEERLPDATGKAA